MRRAFNLTKTELETYLFPCLEDNYGCLVHDPASGVTASIDAPEGDAVLQALSEKGWALTHLLITHHHGDHTAGIGPVKAQTGCHVIGPEAEAERISGLDETVAEGSPLTLAGRTVNVLETPGHTLGHISFWIEDDGLAFVGDTLFAMGCGRVFEGTNPMMWQSLQKLKQLPPETVIFCGHEYTKANAAFALTIEPDNQVLQDRAHEVNRLRADGQATLPTTLAIELETNPFLRPDSKSIRGQLNMAGASDSDVFGEIRERKNKA